ncbi:hypothetical protein [Halorarius halobius]|uniref:hypothetical protein n=1 Tax=Halorarius halobius TaxID=2962671 RepID=UPI0020CCB288|nr:hypothetical protein [Halorarius halobius]
MSVNIRKRDGYAASMPAEILAADDDEDIREMIDVSLSKEFDVETGCLNAYGSDWLCRCSIY